MSVETVLTARKSPLNLIDETEEEFEWRKKVFQLFFAVFAVWIVCRGFVAVCVLAEAIHSASLILSSSTFLS